MKKKKSKLIFPVSEKPIENGKRYKFKSGKTVDVIKPRGQTNN